MVWLLNAGPETQEALGSRSRLQLLHLLQKPVKEAQRAAGEAAPRLSAGDSGSSRRLPRPALLRHLRALCGSHRSPVCASVLSIPVPKQQEKCLRLREDRRLLHWLYPSAGWGGLGPGSESPPGRSPPLGSSHSEPPSSAPATGWSPGLGSPSSSRSCRSGSRKSWRGEERRGKEPRSCRFAPAGRVRVAALGAPTPVSAGTAAQH